MRNLKTTAYRKSELPDGLPLTATAWDTTNNTILCAFGPTSTKEVIELKRRTGESSSDEDFVTITSWDSPCPLPDLECDEILLFQHFSDTATSCLVLAGGDVVVVREDPLPDQEKIEIVGSVDVGICAAAWAPDEEILAIVTRADTLVLMSRTFEPLNEATLSPDDLKVSKQVSVGWGQKETQFQGRRAKAMRDPTVPEKVDQGDPSPYDDGKVSLSWRGDGQYVAINSVVPGHRRLLRVFTREAVLDSASEPADGMESALSWKPSGQLIAGLKRSDSKMEVVFFERNGLRHGQFDLRLSKEDMRTWATSISLAWNTDSSVLAISFQDRVQFWTMGNYHYYLKQEFRLSTQAAKVYLKWHPETPLRALFGAQEHLYDMTFLSSVSRGSTVPSYDLGVVAVVDGKSLKLTPFKQAGVPPPMAFCEAAFDHNITDCAVSQDGQKVAVLTGSTVELCDWQTRVNSKGDLKFTTKIGHRSVPFPVNTAGIGHSEARHYTQVVLVHDEIFILAPSQSTTKSSCWKLAWSRDPDDQTWEQIHVPGHSENLFLDIFNESIFATDTDANTTVLLSSNPLPRDHEATKLNGAQANSSIFSLRSTYSAHLNGITNGHNPKYHKISLTPKGGLYVDDTLLVREVTSYILTSAHLIFTTSSHLLKFVHLTDDPSTMAIPLDTPEIDERCRNIERGGKIVTVIPSIYAVILQMPRGNLETIYPRLLVLSGIRQHLKEQVYLAAFIACQTHQVDMNILHDYDPEAFLADVPKVIDQLKKPARVDEFLSKLKDEDVTKTLYRDTTLSTNTQSQEPPKLPPGSKVNKIADAFLSTLTSKPSSQYIQTIITAHVCKRPPDLPSALFLISSLLRSPEGKDEADTAISHLFFLTPNPNILFDASLSTYDLELTLLVAQNDSARDPREYMPFLQSLQELPQLRRQYTIDNHLKKYDRALTSLHGLTEHEEVRAYVGKHALYTQALDLYKYDTEGHLKAITRLYAEYLHTQKSQPFHAATLYESLGDYNAAYPLYALAHKWRESLTCASMLPLPAEQMKTLAQSLATTMTDENRDYRAAAQIRVDYLASPLEAARLLCKGSYFADALRLLSLHNLTAEIPLTIDSALTEKTGEILELLADCRSQLSAQVPRILELRKKKDEDPLAFYGGDADAQAGEGDILDNISLAPTDASTQGGQSLFTRYGSNSKFGGTVASNVSRKTSKTKRREERKRARGKKGSVYEEEYLVASVARLIERVNGLHEEAERLVWGLLRRGMRELAGRVGEGMKGICEEGERVRAVVWNEPDKDAVVEGRRTFEVDGQGRPSGADGVFWDSQQEGARKEAPVVKSWSGSELL
ncbi:putative elongator complex protein 1 [Cladophialophora chaetospira]|uniref:Elongator complex protein 1 n=1 Tax=Cladophialophora chaetospira TaxID=386627 RepID=A0AA38X765_9EURO|nr:putative elongator complex protein 1 [Cladophialophora chaetospira]